MIDLAKFRERLLYFQSIYNAYVELAKKEPAKLTPGDKKKRERWEKELESLIEPSDREIESLLVGGKLAAEFYGVTLRTIQSWAKERRCPKVRNGKYDLKALLKWWLENIYESKSDGKDKELRHAKVKYWQAKAKNEELRAGKEDAKLMPVDEIASEWTKRMAAVSSGLDMLSYRLPPLLEGNDQDGMRHAIEMEIWRMKDLFCRTGRFCEEDSDAE